MTAVDGASTAADDISVCEAGSEDRAAWEAFVAAQRAADPLQDWGWGEVARVAGEPPVRLLGRDGAGAVAGVAQLLVRDTSFGRRVIYIAHGPLWAGTSAVSADAALDGMLAAVRERAERERAIVVKLDPRAPFPPGDSAIPTDSPPDDSATATAAAPETAAQTGAAIAAALLERGLRPAFADLQATTTRLLDLRPDPDAVFAALEKDTRNLIRRSEREGVTVRVVRDESTPDYETFAALLAETGARARFHTRGAAELSALAAEFAPAGRTYLVLAGLDGRTIAGCLAVRVADRAFYLYAGSLRDRELRHANGAYAALWGLCRALATDGVGWLDLWGVVEPGDTTADPAWAGFSLFKRGFGGVPVRHPGTFDLVVSPLWYRIRDWRERRLARRPRS